MSLSSAGVHLNPVVQRYAWPSELDLMARIAGLRLKYRWGGWNQSLSTPPAAHTFPSTDAEPSTTGGGARPMVTDPAAGGGVPCP